MKERAPSSALTALLAGVEAHGHAVLVIDMAEQGLDAATQKALIAHLRRRARIGARPLFRDDAVHGDPQNPRRLVTTKPSSCVRPITASPCLWIRIPGAPGRESLAMCLGFA